MNTRAIWAAMLAATFAMGLAACEREGPMERAGEEVDEAVDTLKNGEESTSSKADDAMDEMRDGVNDAVDEARE